MLSEPGCRDVTAQLADYGRSVLIDVSAVQSAAGWSHAANRERWGAGPRRRGQGARCHGGSVGEQRP